MNGSWGRIIGCIFFIMNSWGALWAQEGAEQELQQVQGYLQLAQEQLGQNKDSVLWYTQQALELAQSPAAKRAAFGGTKQIAIIAGRQLGDLQLQQQSFEQLVAFSQVHQNDSLLAVSLYGIAAGEHSRGEHRAALKKLEQIQQLLAKANLSEQQEVTLLLLRAELHQALQEQEKAIHYYIEGLQRSEANNLLKEKATSLKGLTQLHQDLGNTQKALDYAQQALEASKATQQLPRIALAHLDLGIAYTASSQENSNYHKLAKEQLEQALEKGKVSQYLPVVGVATLNLATWHQEQGELEKAVLYLQEAIPLLQQVGDQANYWRALMQSAYLHLQFAQQLEEPQKENYQYYLEQAVANATPAYQESQSLGAVDVQIAAAELLASTQAKLGNFKEAYQYLDAYNKLTDSLLNAEKLQIIEETEAQFQNEKKQLQIQLLEEEKATRQAWLFSIGIGLLVALLFLGIVIRLYQQKQKANTQLAAQNELISQQKVLLQKRHEEKEILLKEIHHRVKNNLQIISSLLELQNRSIEDATASLAIEDGQSRIHSMALIHHKLYQNEDLNTVNWRAYTEQLVQQILSMMTQEPPQYTLDIDPAIELDIDTAIPLGLILNELLTNSCKYAFVVEGQGLIKITLKHLEQGHYLLQVWDNGPGLPAGFELRKARSLGLRLVRRLSKQLFGKATYTYNHGSQFTIEFKDSITRKSIA